MTKSMTDFNPGDIVLVRFPFTDLTATKQRPALLINRINYSKIYGDFVLMPLTSQPQTESQLALKQWRQAGLPKPTWIKPIIGTLSRHLVIRVLGPLAGEDDSVVRFALEMIFDDRWRL